VQFTFHHERLRLFKLWNLQLPSGAMHLPQLPGTSSRLD
jgi:hypothetical protein